MAKMAGGHADDLATAVLLATDKPVLVAPAMNPRMWLHPATRRNHRTCWRPMASHFVGPRHWRDGRARRGRCRAHGRAAGNPGRDRRAAGSRQRVDAGRDIGAQRGPLAGRHVLVTAGPTHEPIDPVRYIANRSSGKQGYAIAAAAAALGARVTLVSGPTAIAAAGRRLSSMRSKRPKRCWLRRAPRCPPTSRSSRPPSPIGASPMRLARRSRRTRKAKTPKLELVENPDILKTIAHLAPGQRPSLVIGFAAETENVVEHAKKKRKSKGCDWIVANDVSPETGIMGGDRNAVHLVTAAASTAGRRWTRRAVAERTDGAGGGSPAADDGSSMMAKRGQKTSGCASCACRMPGICRCRRIRRLGRPGSILSPRLPPQSRSG